MAALFYLLVGGVSSSFDGSCDFWANAAELAQEVCMFGLDSKESSFPGKFNLYNPVFKNAETASKIRPEGIHVPIIWNPHLVVLSILAAIFGSFSDLGLMILDDEFHWYAGFPFVRSLI